MFYYFITILSKMFYNRLICLSFVIEIFNFQTVPGTKQHRFIFYLSFYAMPLFFRHQKDSGSWSIYKVKNFFNENCILVFCCKMPKNMPCFFVFWYLNILKLFFRKLTDIVKLKDHSSSTQVIFAMINLVHVKQQLLLFLNNFRKSTQTQLCYLRF